ncbi:MAG: hypothetical protein JWO97_2663 [Acidobacteria bacterium]|nr:hypothetical protein [Acidobacteriota bacterium]
MTRAVRRADVASVVALLALTVTLYRNVVSLWWLLDDVFHLHFLHDHPGFAYLKRDAFDQLPFDLFTPLLFISLDADERLAGLEPAAFHLHQLIALGIGAIVAYAVFRQWLSPLVSFAGSVLIIAGAPLCTIVQELMLRHYVEGFVFAGVTVLLYVQALRRNSVALMIAAACAYLLAAFAKEIYVPLPFALLALPEGTWPRRVRAAIPQGVALLVYLALRRLALGTFGGGYGWAMEARDLPELARRMPRELAKRMFVTPSLAVVLIAIIVIAIVVLARRKKFAPLTIAGLALLALGPVIPVMKAFEARYAFALWLVVAVTIVAGASAIERSWPRLSLLAIAIVATLAANRLEWRTTMAIAERMSVEGRWFMAANADALLRRPAIPPAAMGELVWLKSISGRAAGARWFYDDIFLCSASATSIREFEEASNTIRDVTLPVRQSSAAICDRAQHPAPFSAHFRYDDGVLHWKLGPYEGGQYRFVLGDGAQAFDVPSEEGFRLPGARGLTLRIAYLPPKGDEIYSSPIELDFVNHPDVRLPKRE